MLKRLLLFGSCIVFLFVVYAYIYLFTGIVYPWDRQNAIEATLQWSGLSKLPDSAKILKVEKTGSLFTRGFIVEFEAPESEIRNWKSQSNTLQNAKPAGSLYKVKGQKGALEGKVNIYKTKVKIAISRS